MLIMLALCLTLSLMLAMASHHGSMVHSMHQQQRQRHDTTDIKDKIIELQCLARCENITSLSHHIQLHPQRCLEQCRLELLRAPRVGSCPSSKHLMRQAPLSCLDNCAHDHDCIEVHKCCASSCGPVCVEALGVRNATQLPPIPKILRYKLPRSHKVELTIESSLLPYYFHVEVRSHIGRLFAPRKLGVWQSQQVEKILETTNGRSKFMDISFNIRPGRWYQVRVAAVNAQGFRGYSQPSHAFTLASHPKPPKAPNDLKIVGKHYDGRNYMSVKLIWCPSKSNLPVEKYKITWALYVRTEDGSLVEDEAYVKDTHQFEIKKLQANSSYYIQVQAMSISGSRRLKSEKKALLYNTTLQAPVDPLGSLQCSNLRHRHHHQSSSQFSEISSTPTIYELGLGRSTTSAAELNSASFHYDVRFRLNRKFGMIVQILGFQPHKEKVYELCPQETNCEQREFSAIRVKKDSLEFSKLKYNTTYVLKALRPSPNSVLDETRNAFTFTTPKCDNFRKRFPKMQIRCSDQS
ncbi:LOW QUALITY PROTEIN: anosmin-1 [Drosophila sulfurigaster albostrigata]|uniref:LOW QUALITY PROTEIN: anosmin-1 n=1 Tax=Drosophila sulfurigaster albostrigata TaxID=89887 RepID=UPI002D219636|nr:LOW QUALITY PROTEIN: anosmin-1 [Drosophila sulfurigaster albostrigata]